MEKRVLTASEKAALDAGACHVLAIRPQGGVEAQ